MKTKTLAIARVVITLLLGANISAMGQGAEVSTIELNVGDNMRYTPAVIQAQPRQQVRIVLKGVGKLAALGYIGPGFFGHQFD